MRQMRFLGLGLLVLAFAAGCDVYTPEDNIKEDFSGTVQLQGQSDHNYSFTQKGELEVTIKSVTPTPPAGQLFLGLGSPTNGVCLPFNQFIQPIVVNRVVQFGQVQKGSACLTIFDSPNVSAIRAPTSYTGTISYP